MADDYDQKLRDMQKYVPFLENLIQNLKRSNKHDEKREAQLNKMQMFYDLLTNKNKKLKLETLERCEQVLVKLHQKAEKMKIELPAARSASGASAARSASGEGAARSASGESAARSNIPAGTTPAPVIVATEKAKDPVSIPNKMEVESSSFPKPGAAPISQTAPSEIGNSSNSVDRSNNRPSDIGTSPTIQAESIAPTPKPAQESLPENCGVASIFSNSNGNLDSIGQKSDCSQLMETSQQLDEAGTAEKLPLPSSGTELEVESSTDQVDTPPPVADEESVPSDTPEDWKSTKRKSEPGPSEEQFSQSVHSERNSPTCDIEMNQATPTNTLPLLNEENEPEAACSSMELEEDDKHESSPPEPEEHPNSKEDLPEKSLGSTSATVTAPKPQPVVVSSSTMKNDPEDCSVSSTTAIDPRRDKTAGDESDEQNSLQDTVTDSSSNNEGVNKNWIQGALLNLLNPNNLDKSTVLEMLGKVVDGSKLQKIKEILVAEENESSADKGDKGTDGADKGAEKEVKKEEIQNNDEVLDEVDNKAEEPPSSETDKKLNESKPPPKTRKTELDRLNEDMRFILDTDPENLGPSTKRSCTENKTPNYCEIGSELKSQPQVKETVATAPPPKKKKKKKYEVFSYRTRRRSKRKKPKAGGVAALAGIESGADGTESSLGGGDMEETADAESLLEELPAASQELEETNTTEINESFLAELQDETVSDQPSEAEKNFKNIHPEMHSLSKYVSTCAICNFSGRYVTTHYMNSHRMTEMVVSRLPPPAQDRLMRGEGMESVFTGKDPFQNRVYQFTCPFCNVKKNYARKIWSQHFGSHTGEYKYKCSGCGYMSVNVRGHIMKYCPGSRPIMLENLDRGQDIVGFICKLCNYIQMNREHVISHLELQHECLEGTDELISDVTLFRSDLSNLNTHSAKKQRSIQAVKATPETKKPAAPAAGPSHGSKATKKVEEPFQDEENEGELLEVLPELSGDSKFEIPKPPDGQPLKNIYPYMHSQSEYVTRCVLCHYVGKFITKHYVKEHPESEVFVARIPPERQDCILNNQQLTKLGPVTVVKYKNYYRHSACPFCPVEKSSQRFDWVMHFAIHTGEYKFRCTQCNHYGNARNEFARHFKNGCPNGKLIRMWSHYKYNEEDPVVGFLCKLCNYIQMSRKNVETHLETQHETTSDEILQITLFTGNPRYKGRRSVKGGGYKKSKRSKRKIKHAIESSGNLDVPDFLCEGEVDEEFMAEENGRDDGSPMPDSMEQSGLMDDDDVLPMHQMSADFGDSGFENLFQMEMCETAAAPTIPEEHGMITRHRADNSGGRTDDDGELIRPTEDPIQNIHPEMHSQSAYASKCLLCNFAGKYIAKHYVEEHTEHEVFASRLPPDSQRSLLSGEGCMPIRCLIRSRKMNYYFACPFCNLERDCTRHNWVAHFGIHTGEYKYQCSQCPHRGNASRDFKRHFKGSCRHAQQIRMWPDLVSKEEPILAYFCNLCNYIQLDRGRVIEHLNTQHSCYEQLVSKITLLFIDPKAGETEGGLTTSTPNVTPASTKPKLVKKKFGKKRRPISKMWSTSSQKRAALQRHIQAAAENEAAEQSGDSEEEEEEDGDEVVDEDDNVSGMEGSEQDEEIIEIIDSDDDVPPPVTKSKVPASSYEKIQRFIERTEQKSAAKFKPNQSLFATVKKEDRTVNDLKQDIVLPFSPPTKDRPLSNVHPEMHSQSVYAKKCILCPFVGRHLINHYISFHPRFEVPISRLPPKAQELIARNEYNVAVEIESNPYSPKLFSHTCLFCDTEFTFAIKSWVDHFGTHTGEYNFKCSECGRMINSKHDIHEHIRNFCKKGKALARQFPVTDTQTLLAYICKLCNFIQMNRGNIVQHLRVQHKSLTTADQIMQVTLLRFNQGVNSKDGIKSMLAKREDRIKVENAPIDTKYTTREYVKVEQSDAIYEILVPETELKVPSETPSTSKTIKMEYSSESNYRSETSRNFASRLSVQGGRPQLVISGQPLGGIQSSSRRSAPSSLHSSKSHQASRVPPSSILAEPEIVQRISHLGYSHTPDGTNKYHCCVRSCTFAATTVPIALATHIMDDHPSLIWEGYCRECQGHVATGKNMKLTKEIQHLFEHTRKRPADTMDSRDDQSATHPTKIPRRSITTLQRPCTITPVTSPPTMADDSANQIIARFANNKSITITREIKAASPDRSPPRLQPLSQPQGAVTTKQQQVLKEVKRTALKPWTVSKSVKAEHIVKSLLSDISLFAFFKCMGNDCHFTTNDSNKMAEHLGLHSEQTDNGACTEQTTESNVFSWLECCYCSTWAGTVMQLIAHITAKHSRDIYQCPHCFYRSCEDYNVVTHLKHYHQQQRLSILYCFGRKLLKAGGDLAIQAVKRTQCAGCPCTFMNPLAFATNVSEYIDNDLGGDIYKCYYCSKKHTKSIIEYARHIVEHRPVHKADSYKCFKCFKDQTQLNQLSNKHNIKAFQCVHCAYSTDDEFQIGLHMAQVHASNLLFCGLRIRIPANTTHEDPNARMDNGAAFVLLRKRVGDHSFYKCPYTPVQLNYLNPAIEPQPMEDEEDDEDDSPSCSSPVISQNPGGLLIAQVQSITNTEFASFITIDDDD
ncbi:uncharacterized protein LOC119650279 [Hermetia illucens]|uniref:uncharacterized protein LOC119650279 n=1 Tax=Hermetia illucens TaxID=343691 RepID=UPI0018CC4B9B|nr:uncharacterized protein LOC119650279 [Hermetia illucens]XP_037908843.1 uncharacterized protein LOC119650279 [Hermetia illucens]